MAKTKCRTTQTLKFDAVLLTKWYWAELADIVNGKETGHVGIDSIK